MKTSKIQLKNGTLKKEIPFKQRENNQSKSILPYISAVLFYLVVFGIFFYITKTITSGFHFINDHEYVRIQYDLEHLSFIETIKKWYDNEFYTNHRFRLFFYPLQIIMVILVGSSSYAHSLSSFIVLIASSFFFFTFLYEQKYNYFFSLLFPLLILVGEGFTVYWRLGLQENIAMYMTGMILFLKVISLNSKYKKLLEITLTIIIILLSMIKESFLIMTPFLVFTCLFVDWKNNNYTMVDIFRKNILFISIVAIFIVAQILAIIFFVGTDGANGGGAGVDKQFNISNFIYHLGNAFIQNDLFVIFATAVVFYTSLFLYNYFLNNRPQLAKDLILGVGSFLLIAIPQQFLYLKSGMVERYFLPHQMWFAIFSILCFQSSFNLIKNPIFRSIFCVFVVLLLSQKVYSNFKLLAPVAKAFTMDGKMTNDLLNEIKINLKPNSAIVVAGDFAYAAEFLYSTYHYIRVLQPYPKVYVIQTKYKPYEKYNTFNQGQEDLMKSLFAKDTISSRQLANKSYDGNLDMIICMNNIDNNFLYFNQSWFNPQTFNGYQKIQIGYNILYLKR